MAVASLGLLVDNLSGKRYHRSMTYFIGRLLWECVSLLVKVIVWLCWMVAVVVAVGCDLLVKACVWGFRKLVSSGYGS